MHKPNFRFWKEMPFLRILLSFIPGLIIGLFSPLLMKNLLLLSLPASIIIGVVNRLPAWEAWKWGFLRGLSIILLVFLAGGLISFLNYSQKIKYTSWTLPQSNIETTLAVLEEPTMYKSERYRATASLFEILPGSKKRKRGMAFVYFPKDDVKASLAYGTSLILMSRVLPIQKKGNPGQFDFADYYKRQGIYYQVFLQKGEYILLKNGNGNRFNQFLFQTRNKIIQILQKYISDKKAAGLAEALLIGYRNDLDQSLVNAYANTGVIHVIAISGLHLGLLFAVLMSLTSFLNNSRKKQWLQFLLVISLLWIFSFMTGGSASVIRSAFMFTLVGFGRLTGKKGYPLNSLAAAAFVLLAYQPNWIMDTGFQLSFTAVGSIMIYFDKIRNLLYFKNPLAIKCWDMISVTLSAQILTTPVVLLYFKQFPLLFLFTNMVAVPLSGWILLGEIVLCLFNTHTTIADELGKALEKAIELLNAYVIQMDRVSFSAIRDIYVSPMQVAALYLCIIGLSIWVILKFKSGFLLLLAGITIFSGLQVYNNVKIEKQKEILVLQISGRQSLFLINGKAGLLFTNEPGPGTSGDWKKEILPVNRFFRLEKLQIQYLPVKESLLIRWKGKQIYYLNGKTRAKYTNSLSQADMVIISHNLAIPIHSLFQQNHCLDWIADGTNSLWKIQEWKKESEQLHLRFHSVNESGAYMHNF
ncbi:MAG: ComEC/Rec2 family competence protein [Chitinophagaceae bacterium]